MNAPARTLLLALLAGTASHAHAFELSSPDLAPGQPIPETFAFDAFGCTGRNVSPALAWNDLPAGTRSVAVMVHDPDAPTGGAGFWHWVVVDVPAGADGLARGAGTADGAGLPGGARQMATDFGSPGWGGPCPPDADGPHRYDFTAYALPVEHLEVPDTATASFTGFVIHSMALGSATFEATYDR